MTLEDTTSQTAVEGGVQEDSVSLYDVVTEPVLPSVRLSTPQDVMGLNPHTLQTYSNPCNS